MSLLLCLPGLLAAIAQSQTTTFPGSEWDVVPPETVGFDPAALNAALSGASGNIAVVRYGYLAGTRGNVTQRVPLYSASKSITALLFGVTLQAGQHQMDDLVPGSDRPSAPLASYRQFLSMTSDYGLTPHGPGQHYAYNNKSTDCYGQSLTPSFNNHSPVQILDDGLYSAVGRQDSTWFYGLWGGWGGGFESSARDIARIGHLVLCDGEWDGQQVVPASFIANLYQNQIPANATQSYAIGSGETQGVPGDNWWNQFAISDLLAGNYSFGWWTNASNMYPSIPAGTIWADGLNGNRIFVCPEYDLVVSVTYGGNQTAPDEVLRPILDAIVNPPAPGGKVGGELKSWHNVTVSFDGPDLNEQDALPPSAGYRLNVTFTHGGTSVTVPGYFAADGNAAETGAESGTRWRVHFVPDQVGEWNYIASFRTGALIAASTDPLEGVAVAFDGAQGSFTVSETDKTGRDFRGKGLLQYVGGRYLRFAGTGEAFLKGGADSPENFLAYAGFDQTVPSHSYAPHASDWTPGDTDWRGGAGRNIIGALNYLSSKGMNSVYFLTMNVTGDGSDVWPWTSSGARYRYDCSKLDQWELVFEHMDRKGLMLHVVTQENENDQLIDGGELGPQRRIYYRELIARFGHHLGVTWNLGEENTNTDSQRKSYSDYFQELDPYHHHVVVHTLLGMTDTVYNPLLGHESFNGPSLQLASVDDTYAETLKWVQHSAAWGQPWIATLDEIGPANRGVLPDSVDPNHDEVRKKGLWGNLMAGGAGVEWYFGYAYEHNDLSCEDWRSREEMWDQTRLALGFFSEQVPFAEMEPSDSLTSAPGSHCLVKNGEAWLVYLPDGGSTNLNLGGAQGPFSVRWFDPRNGGYLKAGSVPMLTGSGTQSLGFPPHAPSDDWAVLVQAVGDYRIEYGEGLQGIAGFTPVISADDPRLGASEFKVHLESARPAAPALILVGLGKANLPYAGGSLLNDVSLGCRVRFVDGQGRTSFCLPLPANPGCLGGSLYFQWLVVDSDAAFGVSLTRGLQVIMHN
ncbi:MAG: DUF5060 domain-containing protein [Planctomycetota bacterium]